MTPEQLKASILQRAMEGKLVPQDPNDEPASELLKRIKAEKEKLIKEGKIKRDKNETEIFRGDDGLHYEKFQDGSIKQVDVPYEIPESWEWARLNQVTNFGNFQSVKGNEIPDNAWVLDMEDIEKLSGILLKKVRKNGANVYKSNKYIFNKNTILYGKLRPYLKKVIISDEAGYCTTELFPINVMKGIEVSFFRFILISPYFSGLVNQSVYGVKMPRVGTDFFKSMLVPIPPLNEQASITKKIEVALSKVDYYHELFNTLRQLNNSFPEKLRKSILQYAMQGKLVPQDATDEPVEVLLEKIREEKQRLFAEGKLQKKDLQESIIYQGDDNSYYKMTDLREEQEHWLVQRVKDIFRTIPTKKYQIKQSEILKEGLYPVVSQSKKLIEGYSNSKDKLYQHSKPIIVFGDHTRIVKLIDFDFVVGADGVKLMDPIYIDSEFGYLCLKFCCLDLKNRGYSRHYSHLQNMYIGIPDKTMQLRIVEKIKILDKYLKLLENKINKHI